MNSSPETETVSPKPKHSTWIAFLPFLYIIGFLFLGTFLFWTEALETNDAGEKNWFKIVFSSIFYLVTGIIGFIFVSLITLYRLIKDKALFLAVRRHWPLLIAILYFFIPNMPGPIDEIVVSTIMGALATYLGFRKESPTTTTASAGRSSSSR